MAEITIPLRSHEETAFVLGPYDRFAKLLRNDLDIEVLNKRGNLLLKGAEEDIQEARRRVDHLLGKTRKGRELGVLEIEAILLGRPTASASQSQEHTPVTISHVPSSSTSHGTGARHATVGRFRIHPVEPRNENQRKYMDFIEHTPLVFGVGAAGTGKTYLAVAAAVRMLREGLVRRLVMTRPVVEAGERLGFLPGDMQAKIDPYMRPIYDALYDLIDHDDLTRLEEAGVIEVAPLAYMRGRTLSDAFIILDEGQNTSIAQMKMFLTRMGEGSRVVVTGDPSQNDLPQGTRSGLVDAVQRLRGFKGVQMLEFTADDVVRHPLVAQIVRAYQAPSRVEADKGPAES